MTLALDVLEPVRGLAGLARADRCAVEGAIERDGAKAVAIQFSPSTNWPKPKLSAPRKWASRSSSLARKLLSSRQSRR